MQHPVGVLGLGSAQDSRPTGRRRRVGADPATVVADGECHDRVRRQPTRFRADLGAQQHRVTVEEEPHRGVHGAAVSAVAAQQQVAALRQRVGGVGRGKRGRARTDGHDRSQRLKVDLKSRVRCRGGPRDPVEHRRGGPASRGGGEHAALLRADRRAGAADSRLRAAPLPGDGAGAAAGDRVVQDRRVHPAGDSGARRRRGTGATGEPGARCGQARRDRHPYRSPAGSPCRRGLGPALHVPIDRRLHLRVHPPLGAVTEGSSRP